jgi:hypothetical protein
LVVFGPGVRSEEIADKLVQQCARHDVSTSRCAIDEARQYDLARYPGLSAVLPSPEDVKINKIVALYGGLLGNYRSRRPHGLTQLLRGEKAWFEVGVFHLVGPGVLLEHPEVRRKLVTVCRWHNTDEGTLDLFRAPHNYELELLAAPSFDPETPQDYLFDQWRLVQRWGIKDPRDVKILRNCIDSLRQVYDDPTKSALSKPRHDDSRNALSLILDGDWDPPLLRERTPEAAYKALRENYATVWRDVEKELKTLVPDIKRPRRGGGAVDDLHEFYLALRILDDSDLFEKYGP